MKPVVDRLEKAYAGKVDVKRMSLNGDDAAAEKLATQFGVQYVPTFVLVDAKGVRQDFVVGETPEADLRAKMDALLR
jgi:thioredoxin-like negative regulator of GroEL